MKSKVRNITGHTINCTRKLWQLALVHVWSPPPPLHEHIPTHTYAHPTLSIDFCQRKTPCVIIWSRNVDLHESKSHPIESIKLWWINISGWTEISVTFGTYVPPRNANEEVSCHDNRFLLVSHQRDIWFSTNWIKYKREMILASWSDPNLTNWLLSRIKCEKWPHCEYGILPHLRSMRHTLRSVYILAHLF